MNKKEEVKKGLIKVSEAVKKSLIEEHGKEKLRILELPMDDLGVSRMEVIVKIPNRSVMGQFMRFVENNPKKAQEILLNSCLLSNKEEVDADDALFTTCVSGIAELIPIRQATVKNL